MRHADGKSRSDARFTGKPALIAEVGKALPQRILPHRPSGFGDVDLSSVHEQPAWSERLTLFLQNNPTQSR
jgi:hypothetical protein